MNGFRGFAQLVGAVAALTGWSFSAGAQTGEVYPDPVVAGWNGVQVCRVLQADERSRLIECVFPPGAGHERHFHPPHVGFVIEGGVMEMTTAAGVTQLELETNSSWMSPGVVWHEALNVSDNTIRYLMFEFIEPAASEGADADADAAPEPTASAPLEGDADADADGAAEAVPAEHGAHALEHGDTSPSRTNGRD